MKKKENIISVFGIISKGMIVPTASGEFFKKKTYKCDSLCKTDMYHNGIIIMTL